MGVREEEQAWGLAAGGWAPSRGCRRGEDEQVVARANPGSQRKLKTIKIVSA
jgi:hypothetical protein